jgi:hypothetical protein
MPNRQYRLDDSKLKSKKLYSMQIEMSNAAAQKKLLSTNLQTVPQRLTVMRAYWLQRDVTGAGVVLLLAQISKKSEPTTVIRGSRSRCGTKLHDAQVKHRLIALL